MDDKPADPLEEWKVDWADRMGSDQWQPDRQRVVVVGTTTEWPQGPAGRVEAVQLTFAPEIPIPAGELKARVLEAVKAERHTLDDRRSVIWGGPAGLNAQDIEVALLVGYAATTAAALTVEGVLAGLRTFSHRSRAELAHSSTPLRPDQVWYEVEDFLSRAFKVKEPKALDMTLTSEGWHIRAQADVHEFDITTDAEGRTMRATQVAGPRSDEATDPEQSAK